MTDSYFLPRQSDSGNETFGQFEDSDGHILCMTIERSASDPNHPCIPPGTYECNSFQSPHNGNVWLLKGTEPRTMIEIHAATWSRQLLGCIAVGKSIGSLVDPTTNILTPCIFRSKDTLLMLKSKLPNTFTLTVIGVNS